MRPESDPVPARRWHVEHKPWVQPAWPALVFAPGFAETPLMRLHRNTMGSMASNGDGAVRRDRTLNLQLLVDSAPSLIHTGRSDGYLDFFNQTSLRYVGQS